MFQDYPLIVRVLDLLIVLYCPILQIVAPLTVPPQLLSIPYIDKFERYYPME